MGAAGRPRFGVLDLALDVYAGALPVGISKPKALQISTCPPTKGVISFILPRCSMHRMVRVSASSDSVDPNLERRRSFASQTDRTYDARMRPMKQMNILPCFDDSDQQRVRSCPDGPFWSWRHFPARHAFRSCPLPQAASCRHRLSSTLGTRKCGDAHHASPYSPHVSPACCTSDQS